MKNLANLESNLGISFNNKSLLHQALVHRSYLNENPDFSLDNNERLEFLGDAVLEILVTEYLYFNFPDKAEGKLTSFRASIVNTRTISTVSVELGVEDHLYLSKGEAKDKNSKAKIGILADAFEAIVGAIYLDKGWEAAKKFVEEKLISKLDYILENKLYLDPKSRFQEKAQEKEGITPHYKVLSEEGPDHDKTFEVGVYLDEELITTAKGSSKQEAQVQAAEEGLRARKWL